ncbi:G-protein coupled receptor Mth2 [Octopus bimaculoides]|uniref:G-protein coupled receptors family 2 profile 2 domain-containing protein n=1 Tax=Octopus bimaculoides TaxID=37653 RepID=A0A0L8GGP0_OCTBM|nr:G-protein coupled receptor Mth2 [Octopus bimaculoides]XP_014781526.1 G-protein coupled receptor Mth2 [Octopus bimaculoides]|eukprot:XP_014781525.1 PREDICTED: G-protein coupled receptor Mth2-like [Octopus bimaculoides]
MEILILFMVMLSFSNLTSPQILTYSHDGSFISCPPALCFDTAENNHKRCSCRQDCNLFNECCIDMINNTNFDHKYHPYPSIYYSCRYVDYFHYSVYQFDRCPLNHDVMEYVNSCENPDSNDQLQNTLAFGKTSKILYRNLYCALCHGEKFILCNILYQCDLRSNVSFENISNYVEDGSCFATVKPPSEDLKKYIYSCTEYVANCDQDNNNTKQRIKCESKPMALVYSGNSVFRNIHCATCNGLDEIVDYCAFEDFSFGAQSTPSLTILFNYHTNSLVINDNRHNRNSVMQFTSCPKHAVYDMNTKECRQVIYHPQLNCTTTTLNESEYHITSDGLLYINNTQRLLNQSEFSQDSQGIISICVKNSTTVIPKYSTAERYITYVGLIISIPALAITIIVYLCIPDLRTLPGKLLVSLLSALFVAELLFLISSQVTTFTVLCTSLAIIMHYSFLATFFWMNVMSFDAWHTFSGLTQLRSKGKGTKRFVLYSLYAWTCPLVIVTVSLIFEYIPGNHGLSPDYGNGICWITNGKSLLWLFAIPVIIILCLNILAFILTARGLHLAKKLSSKYLSKHNKTLSFIYIKLSFIMGLTWIFAFLYTFTKIEEFSLLFCILNSFIGLFICLSFLLTKIVCRNFLKQLQKIPKFSAIIHTDISSTSKTQVTDMSVSHN